MKQLLEQHKQNWFDAIDKHNNDKRPEREKQQKKLSQEQEVRRMREAEQFLTERALLNEQQLALKPVETAQNASKPLTKAQMIAKLRGGLPNERQTPEERESRQGRSASRTRTPMQRIYG